MPASVFASGSVLSSRSIKFMVIIMFVKMLQMAMPLLLTRRFDAMVVIMMVKILLMIMLLLFMSMIEIMIIIMMVWCVTYDWLYKKDIFV